MQSRKLIKFIVTYSIVGLLAAYLIVSLFPSIGGTQQPVVEIEQVPASNVNNNSIGTNSHRGPVSYADAVESAAPAVVNIYTTKIVTQRIRPYFDDPFFRQFFGEFIQPRKRLENSLGSGVIISTAGYVLTNNHVIDGADEILVALQDGRSRNAELVGSDPETDLAVLKIALDNLPTITLGQSETLRVGDVVLAIGNPFSVGQTVTLGIVSATSRNDLGINTFENFIQTDAAINPGNSGGALINPYGHLIGINTAIFSKSGGSQGIGFAIPMSIAKMVLEQIIQYGHVIRGWLGVELQDMTQQLAESFGIKDLRGVIVAGVLRNGPADRANIKPGDIILTIGNNNVANSHEALRVISQIKPDTTVDSVVLRNGKKLTLPIIIAQRPIPRSE